MLTSVVTKRQSDRVGRSFGRRRSSSVRLSKPILFASDFFSWHALLLSPFNVWDSVCLKWLDTPHLLLLFLLWQKVRSLYCVTVSESESFCLLGKQGYRKQLIVNTLCIKLSLTDFLVLIKLIKHENLEAEHIIHSVFHFLESNHYQWNEVSSYFFST